MLQTILIPRSTFTLQQAVKWLIDNNYSHKKVDNTEHFYRFRQVPPTGHKFYTKKLPNGIDLVYMEL
jgi:hypothetical protein